MLLAVKVKEMNNRNELSAVIGYRRGDFKCRLCRHLGVGALNIEFLDCPKFGELKEYFQVKEIDRCTHFHKRFLKKKKGVALFIFGNRVFFVFCIIKTI